MNRDLNVPVGQHAVDALVSVCYNIGIAGFLGSTFLRCIDTGDMAGARAAILKWQKPASIVIRRRAEAEQFPTLYTAALPRPASTDQAITVAAPVIEVMHPEVPTPVIAPVLPPPRVFAAPNWLGRLGRWIDDRFGAGSTATANDNAAPSASPPDIRTPAGLNRAIHHRDRETTMTRKAPTAALALGCALAVPLPAVALLNAARAFAAEVAAVPVAAPAVIVPWGDWIVTIGQTLTAVLLPVLVGLIHRQPD